MAILDNHHAWMFFRKRCFAVDPCGFECNHVEHATETNSNNKSLVS